MAYLFPLTCNSNYTELGKSVDGKASWSELSKDSESSTCLLKVLDTWMTWKDNWEIGKAKK